MELKLKPISREGISGAISKVELYRYLNEPGEAESICRDILAVDSENQPALRLLGLSITDQFRGHGSDPAELDADAGKIGEAREREDGQLERAR